MSNRIQENENEHEDEIAAKINEEWKQLDLFEDWLPRANANKPEPENET